ncbi:MAG TPA: MurR/RpiR family transcriptional regulator [Acidimicrobiia bacterium]|nr:MurR/RpiR family transcriptional regulator [Acidimicrobiia bacterium]
MKVSARIAAHLRELTPAERKVAAVVADGPEAVAFGTVADVARKSGASGATVVRLAAKLGYDGFVELQAAVRDELTTRLRPASERIRRPAPGDVVGAALATEMANVAASLEGADPELFEEAVELLSASGSGRGGGRVFVLSGDASFGVASMLAAELSMLRPGVVLVGGSEVRVARILAEVGPSDVVVVLDVARYDRAVVEAAGRAAAAGAALIALTDSGLSPPARAAAVSFTVAVAGAGPFDSHVGMLALANTLLAGVAARLRRSATDRLDRVEAAWRAADVLTDG